MMAFDYLISEWWILMLYHTTPSLDKIFCGHSWIGKEVNISTGLSIFHSYFIPRNQFHSYLCFSWWFALEGVWFIYRLCNFYASSGRAIQYGDGWIRPQLSFAILWMTLLCVCESCAKWRCLGIIVGTSLSPAGSSLTDLVCVVFWLCLHFISMSA